MLRFEIIEHNSFKYQASVVLRSKVLRIPLGLKFSEEELENEYNQIHFGVFDNDLLVGILIMVPSENQSVKMRQVAIDPYHQAKGIGVQLVQFSEKYVEELGFEKIELHARETAKRFYEKLNYKTDNKLFYEIGIPHFKMWKKL